MTRPIANSRRGPSFGRSRSWNGERPPGRTACQARVEQIERAGDAQRVVGVGHGDHQRGDAESGAEHVEDEAERDAAERHQPGRRPLADRARDEIDHVGARRQHHAERDQREGDPTGEVRQLMRSRETGAATFSLERGERERSEVVNEEKSPRGLGAASSCATPPRRTWRRSRGSTPITSSAGWRRSRRLPPTDEEMRARRLKVLAVGAPYLVAEIDGEIVGYCYAAPYHARPAYRHTLEDSVYVAPGLGGRGVGGALLAALIARCEAGPWR